jgi:hypothetical protein
MIRTLARLLNDPFLTSRTAHYSTDVFLLHPYQISEWLEAAWTFARTVPTWLRPEAPVPFLGDPHIIAALGFPTGPDPVLTRGFLRSGIGYKADEEERGYRAVIPGFSMAPEPGDPTFVPGGLPWDHAAYAYFIESTGVFEILKEVTRRYAIGEMIEPPSLATRQWLRSTEELFFRDSPLFRICGITSQLRPDPDVTRQNLYWRLFGMDLPQAVAEGEAPWKRDVGVYNMRFQEMWVDLLRQVWIGYENVSNISGAKPTDPAYIAEICRYLKDMLGTRRINGQLAREEFVAVSQLSWFHLTVESNTPLIVDLRAEGTDPCDRLMKIAQRVNIPEPSPNAWELFQIADLASTVLRFIELGYFDSPNYTPLFYTLGTSLQRDMIRLVNLWEMATFDCIKDQGVRMAVCADQPPRHAPQARSLSDATNGHMPVVGSATP